MHSMMKSVALVIASAVLLLAGCSKSSQITKAGNTTSLIDWGVVELSANTPKHLSLGEGKDCTVTAILLADGKLEVKIETKEKLAGAQLPPGIPARTPRESTRTQTMTVPATGELMVSVGQRPVRFTPKFIAP
jgi:hypothetical protein